MNKDLKDVINKLKQERTELENKRNKLEKMLVSDKETTYNTEYLMRKQLEIMNNYIDVLSERIEQFIYELNAVEK